MDSKPEETLKAEKQEQGEAPTSTPPPPEEAAPPANSPTPPPAEKTPLEEPTLIKETTPVEPEKVEKEVPRPVTPTGEVAEPPRAPTPSPPSPVARPASPAVAADKPQADWSNIPSLLTRPETPSSDGGDLLDEEPAILEEPSRSVKDLLSFHENKTKEVQSRQSWTPKNTVKVTDPAGQIKAYTSQTDVSAPAPVASSYSASLFEDKANDSHDKGKTSSKDGSEELVTVVLNPPAGEKKGEVAPQTPERQKVGSASKKDGTPDTQAASVSSQGDHEPDVEMQGVQRDLFGDQAGNEKKSMSSEEKAKKKKRTIFFILAIVVAAAIAVAVAVTSSSYDSNDSGDQTIRGSGASEDERPPDFDLPDVLDDDEALPGTLPTSMPNDNVPAGTEPPVSEPTNAPTLAPVPSPGTDPTYWARLERAVSLADALGIDLDDSNPLANALNSAVQFVTNEDDTTETSRVEQRMILAGLQAALIGQDSSRRQLQATRNFARQNVDECNWNGIVCEEGNVVELRLGRRNYKGIIPSFVSYLTDLRLIDLNTNGLGGDIPESLYNMTGLEKIYLYGNELSGSVSESIGKLASLEELRLDSNELTGSIPDSLSDLGGTLRKFDLRLKLLHCLESNDTHGDFTFLILQDI
jgi:hypothetical protein